MEWLLLQACSSECALHATAGHEERGDCSRASSLRLQGCSWLLSLGAQVGNEQPDLRLLPGDTLLVGGRLLQASRLSAHVCNSCLGQAQLAHLLGYQARVERSPAVRQVCLYPGVSCDAVCAQPLVRVCLKQPGQQVCTSASLGQRRQHR